MSRFVLCLVGAALVSCGNDEAWRCSELGGIDCKCSVLGAVSCRNDWMSGAKLVQTCHQDDWLFDDNLMRWSTPLGGCKSDADCDRLMAGTKCLPFNVGDFMPHKFCAC